MRVACETLLDLLSRVVVLQRSMRRQEIVTHDFLRMAFLPKS
jgi:hypothetical protein